MNELALNIDETGARGARPTGLLADRTRDRNGGSREPAWAAVGSMALGVFALVTAEFLPASLLTPIAADFKISEGAAGQTVTATAALALLSASSSRRSSETVTDGSSCSASRSFC
jgi:hypothetical protein